MYSRFVCFRLCSIDAKKKKSCGKIYFLCAFVSHKLWSTRAACDCSSHIWKVKKHEDVSDTETVGQGLIQAISLLQARGCFSLSSQGEMVEKLSALMTFLGIRLSWKTIFPRDLPKITPISSPRSIRVLSTTPSIQYITKMGTEIQ